MSALAHRVRNAILGQRPFNTIFAYNYHNIRPIVEFLRKQVTALPNRKHRLLDVGGGAAPYHPLFAGKTGEYIVIDVESALPADDPRGVVFVQGFAENLPFPDESFDIVMSNQVLEHVNDERIAVTEAYRVLKSGGAFIGSVPHVSPIHLEPYDFRRFTVLGLNKLLRDARFENIVIEGNGGVHRAAALMILMDWYLSPYVADRSQHFDHRKHLLLFPLTGAINALASVLDALITDKHRTPSNYCWIAHKVDLH